MKIGVDLDGTLARYDVQGQDDYDATVIGEPLAPMVERVKGWLDAGHEVVILTARACPMGWNGEREVEGAVAAIKAWCADVIGQELDVTCVKDPMMEEIWDDKARQVAFNEGVPVVPDEGQEPDPEPGELPEGVL